MALILTFVALAVVGQAANLAIAIAIENTVSEALSVPVFFLLLLTMFWAAWRTALWLTQPAEATDGSRDKPRHQAHA